MKRPIYLTAVFLAALCFFSTNTNADVVLTFDQSGIGNGTTLDPNYGDRVVAGTDGSGHAYDIVTGAGLGLTPNVEVNYTAGAAALWTTGYGDLTNVYYDEVDFNDGFDVEFVADTGFEVGVFGFDMAAFEADTTIPGIEILDGNSNVLWSVGSTTISGSARNSFDTGGLFADSLTIAIDLTGLGNASDNIGIDNIQFGQRVAAIPEPTGTCVLLAGVLALAGRRRRNSGV